MSENSNAEVHQKKRRKLDTSQIPIFEDESATQYINSATVDDTNDFLISNPFETNNGKARPHSIMSEFNNKSVSLNQNKRIESVFNPGEKLPRNVENLLERMQKSSQPPDDNFMENLDFLMKERN